MACCLAALPGCKRPITGAPTTSAQVAGGPEIRIASASVLPNGHVLVALTLSRGGARLSRAEALALRPTFTLARLSTHPVDGLVAWESLLLTGGQTAAQLPPAGPVTPPGLVIANVRQPGVETSGTFGGEDGEFTYEFATALPAGFLPTATFRVGVYLSAAEGTASTNATHDFRPAGGSPAPRDTVLDANCNRCHGAVRAHGGRRVGVKICLTCHTWQNSDPDTVDPAALDGATAATDPNPLELGRLVHRIHRGRNLPTLYQAAAGGSTVPAPALPSATALPLPFSPSRTGGATPANPPIAGRKFSVIGHQSREFVFGRVVSRTDNQMPARVVATGVVFPRDLRDCEACHGGAPQEYEVLYAISRRTCHGCHPETWFDATPITDPVHFAHTGGPQADETKCADCHVSEKPPQKLYAPLAEIHVAPRKSPRHNAPGIVITRVQDLLPGGVPDGAGGTKGPTVIFKLQDRVGDLLQPNAPSPANDTTVVTPSPVPRAFSSLAIRLAGPTTPDFAGAPAVSSGDAGNASVLALVADAATHELAYTFASTLPATATGTWAVALEGRRRATPELYSTTTDTFNWPYTGEQVTESPDNAMVYVDTATGRWTAADPGSAVPRRTVVQQEKCERCHGRFEMHGGQRHQVAYCLVCHTPERTDWGSALGAASVSGRPKSSPSGTVNLAGTFDGIEERSIHLKVLVHRIHTGARTGAAALDLVEPHVVYGYGGTPFFLDEGMFPNDLRDCTLCHEGRTYAVEAIPADAPPTVANENPSLRHVATKDALGDDVPATSAHVAGEPATPPIQAACRSCHGTGVTLTHAALHTSSGVESCPQCHVRGSLSVDLAHGLAAADAGVVAATFSSIAAEILVPRCASAACHGGSPPASFPTLDAAVAYDAIVGVPSQQASGVSLVEPFAPERSYLLLKLRGEAGGVGGIGTLMPIGDAALDPSQVAAVEAWIANGAPND
jgi:OmcA/MtrC family decaheme c-type cytochrome